MELEPQLITKTNLHPKTMFYDTFSKNNYPSAFNNINNITVLKRDMEFKSETKTPNPIVEVGASAPQVTNNSKVVTSYENSKYYKPSNQTRISQRDSYRPISPRDCESDEGCKTFYSSSRDSLSPENSGLKCNGSHIGMYSLSEENLMFNKYSQSSPNIYSNVQFSSPQGFHNGGQYRNR